MNIKISKRRAAKILQEEVEKFLKENKASKIFTWDDHLSKLNFKLQNNFKRQFKVF